MTDKNKKNKELNVLLKAAGILENDEEEDELTDQDDVFEEKKIPKKYKHSKSSKDRANRQIQWDHHMLHLPRGKIPGVDKSHARKEAAQRLNLPTKPPSDWHYDADQIQPTSRKSKTSRIRTSTQKARKDEYNRQLQWDLHVLGIRPGKVPGMKRTKARQLAAQRLGKEEYAPMGWKYTNNSKKQSVSPQISLPSQIIPQPNPVVVMREIPLAPPLRGVSYRAVDPVKSKRNQKAQKDAYNRQLQWDLHVLGIPAGRVPDPGRSVARRIAAERLGTTEQPPSNWKYIPIRYKQ